MTLFPTSARRGDTRKACAPSPGLAWAADRARPHRLTAKPCRGMRNAVAVFRGIHHQHALSGGRTPANGETRDSVKRWWPGRTGRSPRPISGLAYSSQRVPPAPGIPLRARKARRGRRGHRAGGASPAFDVFRQGGPHPPPGGRLVITRVSAEKILGGCAHALPPCPAARGAASGWAGTVAPASTRRRRAKETGREKGAAWHQALIIQVADRRRRQVVAVPPTAPPYRYLRRPGHRPTRCAAERHRRQAGRRRASRRQHRRPATDDQHRSGSSPPEPQSQRTSACRGKPSPSSNSDAVALHKVAVQRWPNEAPLPRRGEPGCFPERDRSRNTAKCTVGAEFRLQPASRASAFSCSIIDDTRHVSFFSKPRRWREQRWSLAGQSRRSLRVNRQAPSFMTRYRPQPWRPMAGHPG